MAKKFKFGFNDTKSWKTKFRLVLLIPLVFVMFYIAANIVTTGSPTGQVIGVQNDTSKTDSYTVTDFENNNVVNNELDLDEESTQNDNENISENQENTTPVTISSGGGSSGTTTTTDTNEDESNNPPEEDLGCTEAPKTETFIETDNTGVPQINDFSELWGTVTINNNPAEDWLNVTVTMLNDTLISRTQTCRGYYSIGIPKTSETEIIILVDEIPVKTVNWTAGIHENNLVVSKT
ncbi:hypothetical protein GQ473_06765 [archaeon]|nr:hypothetical protein [archaeon]